MLKLPVEVRKVRKDSYLCIMSEQEENKNLSGKARNIRTDEYEQSSVKCGLPSELGDESIDDYVLIPKALVGHHPEMFVPASGDSMLDAGFEDGDLLPVVKELSRMAVMSFARPVSMWDVNYAPVGGKWFYDYLQIAQDMDKLLSGEDQSAQ